MADFNVTFKLTGGKELERMLQALGPVPAGRAGTNAVRAGARVFARKMRENIRGQGLVLSGRMLRSIKVTDGDRTAGQRIAYAGSTLFYAKFSEFGTRRQSPTPWARPAVDEGAREAIDAMGISLGNSIEREAAKYATAPGSKVTPPKAQSGFGNDFG